MTNRVDGPLKVTGRAKYGADNNFPGMVYGYLVVSTIANGTIRSMDVTTAKQSPGVIGVYSPFDQLEIRRPTSMFGPVWVPLQDNEVAYRGQPIGFVVAETFEQARDAAMTVQVDYDVRPAVTSLAQGMVNAVEATPYLGEPPTLTILADGVESIEDALAASEHTVSATYTTSPQGHAAMEPHSAVAVWESGRLTIYSGNQAMASQASDVAGALGIEPADVRAVNPFVGGAFGGKFFTYSQAFLASVAARVLDRPVKVVFSREQVFTATATRSATIQKIALGAAADGSLNALRHDSWCSMLPGQPWNEATGHRTSRLWYSTPNMEISQKVAEVNLPLSTIMRGPGEAPGSFAVESAMDELAIKLGMDPIDLRLKNYATVVPGGGKPWSSKHLDECYRVGAERFGWVPRPQGTIDGDWYVGVGMATAAYPAFRIRSSMNVRFLPDDTAVVSGSTADLGTGMWTVLSIVGAESLGIPMERITPNLGDSDLAPAGWVGGSATTASVGSAIALAAEQATDALLALAASDSGSPFFGEEVSYSNGEISGGGRAMSFGALLRAVGSEGVEATGLSQPGEERGKYAFDCFGAQFCEVRVHRLTAEARVSRMLGVFDAGRILNPKAARNQLVGGMVWGVSAALHEGLDVEPDGRLANGNLAEYLLPVNADIPDVDVHFLEYPDTIHNPLGAKGIGELGIVGMAAAVANAIHNATGKRVRHLPISLEDLLD
jgi:xanthine dehydrogenase YagR molybdenum-binding subunit